MGINTVEIVDRAKLLIEEIDAGKDVSLDTCNLTDRIIDITSLNDEVVATLVRYYPEYKGLERKYLQKIVEKLTQSLFEESHLRLIFWIGASSRKVLMTLHHASRFQAAGSTVCW